MTAAEIKAKQMIAETKTEELLTQWELTSVIDDKNIPTVRGWLMDEISKRFPKEFDLWLEGEADDFELRKYITTDMK